MRWQLEKQGVDISSGIFVRSQTLTVLAALATQSAKQTMSLAIIARTAEIYRLIERRGATMPTNEDRRMIAARLNKCADTNFSVPVKRLAEILGLTLEGKYGGYTVDSVHDLADLIEPQHERTCKTRSHGTDNHYMKCFSCSRCNAGWFESIHDKPFSYCPHCGAKVMQHE